MPILSGPESSTRFPPGPAILASSDCAQVTVMCGRDTDAAAVTGATCFTSISGGTLISKVVILSDVCGKHWKLRVDVAGLGG